MTLLSFTTGAPATSAQQLKLGTVHTVASAKQQIPFKLGVKVHPWATAHMQCEPLRLLLDGRKQNDS